MRSAADTSAERDVDPGRLVAPALVVAVASVSVSAILVRFSISHPVVLAFYRLVLSAAILMPWAVGQHRRQPTLFQRQVLPLVVGSGCLLGLHYVLWFSSLHLTSVASATVFVTVHPLFVLPLSYVLWREKSNVKAIASLAIALIGGVLISMDDWSLGGDHFVGDLLALGAAGAMAGYLMIGAVVRQRIPLVTYITAVYGIGAVALFTVSLAGRFPRWPIPPSEWLVITALCAVPTLMGHNLFNWALRHTSPAVVSVSVLGEPVGATLLAAWIFFEVPSWIQMFGGTLIILGVALFTLNHRARVGGRSP